METNKINEIWQKGRQTSIHHTKKQQEMEAIISTKTAKTGNDIRKVFRMGLVVEAMTIAIYFFNLFRYRTLFPMFMVSTIAIVLLILFGAYTLKMLAKSKLIEVSSKNLKELLTKKISFYKNAYSLWVFSYAFSMVLLIIGLQMIYKPFEFPGIVEGYPLYLIYVFGFFIAYFAHRDLNRLHLQEFETCLSDLEENTNTDLDAARRKFKRGKIILATIGIVVLLLIIMFLYWIR